MEQPLSKKCLAKNKRRCKQVQTTGHEGSATAWHMTLEFCTGDDRGKQKSIATSVYIYLFQHKHKYMAQNLILYFLKSQLTYIVLTIHYFRQ